MKTNLFLFSILVLGFLLLFAQCRPFSETPMKLPALELQDWDKKSVSLTGLAQKKILVLDVWASWCEPCQDAVPVIEKLQKNLDPKIFQFYGLNTDTDLNPEEVKRSAQTFGMTYPSLLDPEHKLVEALEIQGQPALLVFNRKGELQFQQLGIQKKDYTGLLLRSENWK